jgi:lactoylglutathione lyase
MELAKPALDVGLYTNQLDPMLAFWQEQAGVEFSELLPVGGGVHQHRHAIGDSILKVNHSRDPLDRSTPSGLKKLVLFSDQVDERQELMDPDGNEVDLAPRADDSPNLRLVLEVNDLARSSAFYGNTLELPRKGDTLFAAGNSEIELVEGTVAPIQQKALGYRYMTFQVFDVVGEHAHIISHGGSEGRSPIRLGEVAYISFVRDPDGNWIEISQRKSITGSLD